MNLYKDVSSKKAPTEDKIRGGYYTPILLAEYLCNWALNKEDVKILEPSVGDGNFIEAVIRNKNIKNAQITAIEIKEKELLKAKTRIDGFKNSNFIKVNWVIGDFFLEYKNLDNDFDVIIGNPPFIRFQNFNPISRETAFSNLRKNGYNPSGLSNAWVAFIQLSINLLKTGGKLAMVVPAELLQVNYARELRSRLSKQFDHIVIIGFRKLVFPEIQQEILLLLAEGKHDICWQESAIQTIEYENGNELLNSNGLLKTITHTPSKHTRNGMKWTALFLSEDSYHAIDKAERLKNCVRLGNLASVDVGVVTGRNKYFILSKKEIDNYQAKKYFCPIIGKTSSLQSILFTEDDLYDYEEKYDSFLLDLNRHGNFEHLSREIQDYLKNGEELGVNTGYKCRIRKIWYHIPSVYKPDAFLFRQIYNFPLMALNKTNATSTDTIHRVRFKPGVNHELLAFCFFNSLTLAWAEVSGRSYGGGVLELEPSEAESLPIPYSEDLEIDFNKTDLLMRSGKYLEALDYADEILLRKYLKLSKSKIIGIRKAWIELRNRRNHRKNKLAYQDSA